LLQVKGHSFLLNDLFAGHAEVSAPFENGLFCTIYLSPKDYHRIHLPTAGRLTDMIYVPGRLFSVNQRTTRVVPNLFSRNERVICVFETQFGMMALILVGALFVGSMETVWAGELPPQPIKKPQHWQYHPENAPTLQQGQEMGRFNMGSTVIVLMQKQQIRWLPEYTMQCKLLMGQKLAQCLS
jgi:phosphatidylserine decarboxylase